VCGLPAAVLVRASAFRMLTPTRMATWMCLKR
jgi:hypothetical protein